MSCLILAKRRILDIDSSQRVEVTAVKEGQPDLPLKRRIPYDQLKPVKVGKLHPFTSLTSAPSTSIPSTPISLTSISSTSIPSTSISSISVTSTSIPSTSISSTSIPSTSDVYITGSSGPKPRPTRGPATLPIDSTIEKILEEYFVDQANDMASSKSWVNSQQIDHFMALLKEKFPYVDGLQPSYVFLCEEHTRLGTPKEKFIQIVNVSNNHWITLSNIPAKHRGHIYVYDSLYTKVDSAYRPKFVEQLAWLLHTPTDAITIHWPDVQRQSGGNDCGLFAIANAMVLGEGKNPEDFNWDQGKLRNHLHACMLSGKLSLPPVCSATRHQKPRCPIEVEPVFCLCRQPYLRDRLMVECTLCKEWFHHTCDEKVPEEVSRKEKFICSSCSML